MNTQQKIREILSKLDEAVILGEGIGIDNYAYVTKFYLKDAEAQLLELMKEARIDEHKILDDLAERTSSADADRAIDDYAAAKEARLAELEDKNQ